MVNKSREPEVAAQPSSSSSSSSPDVPSTPRPPSTTVGAQQNPAAPKSKSKSKLKLKKQRSKPNPTKMPAAKKVKKDRVEGAVEEAAKKLVPFQRVWSEEDEIILLQGILEYKKLKGADPVSNMNDFHNFIKKSVHVVDVKRKQVTDKVCRLRTMYWNNFSKKKKKASTPHKEKVVELSKRIWGDNVKAAAEMKMEDKWRHICLEECALFIRRVELVLEETKMIIKALE